MASNFVQHMAIANQVLDDMLLEPGRLGRVESDGSITLVVPDKPRYLFVRKGAGQSEVVVEAQNIHAPQKEGLRVFIRKELNGHYTIVGVDHTSEQLEDDDYNVAYHQHDRDSGLTWIINPTQLEVGRVHWLSDFTVRVTAFRYYYDGAWNTYEGADLDLASYQPGTAGTRAWVVVGVDPDTNTAVAATGDLYSVNQPLHARFIDDVDIGNAIPLAAIVVRASDTDLGDHHDYFDAHGWFNMPGTGAGAVESVNGLTGVVVLDPDDLDDTATANKFITAAELALIATAVQPGDLATVATTGAWADLVSVPGEISSIAGLTSAANTFPYYTAADAAALATVTAFALGLLDDADAATGRATLGAVGLTGTETIAGTKTFSSPIVISVSGTATINVLNAAGNAKGFAFTDVTNGARWTVVSNAAAESGSNAGSNFVINRFDDSGAFLGTAFQIARATGYVQLENRLGVQVAPSGIIHADQSSTTAAIPVLILDQADLSEEMIEFVTTVGAGNPIDTAAIGTYYGKVRVNVSGVGYKYIPLYNT